MKLVNGKRSQLLEYLMIIAGTGLMALAINSVFDASGMVTGGFSGIAIIIKAGSQGIIDLTIAGTIPTSSGTAYKQKRYSGHLRS